MPAAPMFKAAIAKAPEVTFQIEKFGAVFAEAQPMLRRHFHEVALHQDEMPLAPDVARYQGAEAQGSLLIVTVRLDGNLVGYASVIIGQRMHSVGITSALVESIWLAPECRGQGLGTGLFDAVEKAAAERGALTTLCHSKLDHPALAHLLDARGYERIEIVHSKFASDKHNSGAL